ncbi:hypothetical protein PR202_ga17835 [Eleusine coracana subsp. coracana]|uniref:Chalcone--flavonone isomerase n=1 Tax=Eleusine coracana subsp. coracana TaxID=191504 RepID=A0AAV5CQE7_ELECO|nr:hypothetical protein PR202_ga17835 [Eleusine coracana subsp. coracana]
MQNLTKLQFGSLVREEHAVQLLLAGLANATIGRLWNDFELQNSSKLLTLAGAAAIVPQLENISPKMLAESLALGNFDSYVSRRADQPNVQGKCLSCSSVSVPNTIFKEDAIEPKTGIKFPAFLKDDSSSSATVLVGIGFKGMRIMRVKNLNLYAFGLYMQPNTVCEKLGPKYASIPTTKLMDSPDFYNDLLSVFEQSLGLRFEEDV